MVARIGARCGLAASPRGWHNVEVGRERSARAPPQRRPNPFQAAVLYRDNPGSREAPARRGATLCTLNGFGRRPPAWERRRSGRGGPARMPVAPGDRLPPGDGLRPPRDDRRQRSDDRLWPKEVCSGSETIFSLPETIVSQTATIVFGQRRFAPAQRRPSLSRRRSSLRQRRSSLAKEGLLRLRDDLLSPGDDRLSGSDDRLWPKGRHRSARRGGARSPPTWRRTST